jgi:hypothetical protein
MAAGPCEERLEGAAAVKKIDPTKNVTASASPPTSAA